MQSICIFIQIQPSVAGCQRKAKMSPSPCLGSPARQLALAPQSRQTQDVEQFRWFFARLRDKAMQSPNGWRQGSKNEVAGGDAGSRQLHPRPAACGSSGRTCGRTARTRLAPSPANAGCGCASPRQRQVRAGVHDIVRALEGWRAGGRFGQSAIVSAAYTDVCLDMRCARRTLC